MSAQPVSFDDHPPHGHPDNKGPSTQKSDKPSTASHPPPTKPDPTTTDPHLNISPENAPLVSESTKGLLSTFAPGDRNASQAGQSSPAATSASEQSSLEVTKSRIQKSLRQFEDFPEKGILFEDIMPIFANPQSHNDLINALEMQIKSEFGGKIPDIIVGLESRGFLFGPSLALRLGAGFVPVRKQGKLPGPTETAGYQKEYGTDYFQIQSDALKKGQTVVIMDDIIATGGSAAAAGSLVKKIGGDLMGYVFLMELDFLKGRDKLDAPVYTLLTGQEAKDKKDTELPLGRTKESAEEVKPVQHAGGAAAETRA